MFRHQNICAYVILVCIVILLYFNSRVLFILAHYLVNNIYLSVFKTICISSSPLLSYTGRGPLQSELKSSCDRELIPEVVQFP